MTLLPAKTKTVILSEAHSETKVQKNLDEICQDSSCVINRFLWSWLSAPVNLEFFLKKNLWVLLIVYCNSPYNTTGGSKRNRFAG